MTSPAERSAEVRLTLATILLVLSSYVFIGMMCVSDRENPNPRDAPYNLLARGLLAGHLYLDKEAPAGLVALADPYDPEANRPFTVNSAYHLHDLSYYRGRLYLYFGAAPALLVFIPWHLLTGGWLAQWVAVVALCAAKDAEQVREALARIPGVERAFICAPAGGARVLEGSAAIVPDL